MASDCQRFIHSIPSEIAGHARIDLLVMGQNIGLLQQNPKTWFKWQPAGQGGLSDAEIEEQIAARLAARQGKNFAEADRIRDALAAQGIVLEDKAGATTWRRG